MNDFQTTEKPTPYANLNVCDFCFGGGFCSVDRDGLYIPLEPTHSINNQMRGVKRCVRCDYWEKRLAKVRG